MTTNRWLNEIDEIVKDFCKMFEICVEKLKDFLDIIFLSTKNFYCVETIINLLNVLRKLIFIIDVIILIFVEKTMIRRIDDAIDNFKRFDNIMMILLNVSYFFTSFIALFNSKKFFQASNWDSYSFQRTKYFESRVIISRLLINRSIFYDLTRLIFFSTKTKSSWFDLKRR